MKHDDDSDADDDSAYGLSTCEISSVLVRTKWLAHRFFDACDSDRAFKANAHALAIVRRGASGHSWATPTHSNGGLL